MSGDGMGAFETGGGDSQHEHTAAELSAVFDNIAELNATATTITKAEHASVLAKVVGLFGKTSGRDKIRDIEDVLIYYFAVHGTSPDTEWASYEYEVTYAGIKVKAYDVIKLIRLHRLKKFMAAYELRAVRAVQASESFRRALAERAARAGLPPGQEYLAIDYVGKGGQLSSGEMATRVISKDKLLNYRARNANSISAVRREQNSSSLEDARSLNTRGTGNMSFD